MEMLWTGWGLSLSSGPLKTDPRVLQLTWLVDMSTPQNSQPSALQYLTQRAAALSHCGRREYYSCYSFSANTRIIIKTLSSRTKTINSNIFKFLTSKTSQEPNVWQINFILLLATCKRSSNVQIFSSEAIVAQKARRGVICKEWWQISCIY